jgi:hypothetical protein
MDCLEWRMNFPVPVVFSGLDRKIQVASSLSFLPTENFRCLAL